MNADEARVLTEKNQGGVSEALTQIKAMAESGNSSAILWNVKAEAMPELMRLGYSVRIHKDPVNGQENHICSW